MQNIVQPPADAKAARVRQMVEYVTSEFVVLELDTYKDFEHNVLTLLLQVKGQAKQVSKTKEQDDSYETVDYSATGADATSCVFFCYGKQ